MKKRIVILIFSLICGNMPGYSWWEAKPIPKPTKIPRAVFRYTKSRPDDHKVLMAIMKILKNQESKIDYREYIFNPDANRNSLANEDYFGPNHHLERFFKKDSQKVFGFGNTSDGRYYFVVRVLFLDGNAPIQEKELYFFQRDPSKNLLFASDDFTMRVIMGGGNRTFTSAIFNSQYPQIPLRAMQGLQTLLQNGIAAIPTEVRRHEPPGSSNAQFKPKTERASMAYHRFFALYPTTAKERKKVKAELIKLKATTENDLYLP